MQEECRGLSQKASKTGGAQRPVTEDLFTHTSGYWLGLACNGQNTPPWPLHGTAWAPYSMAADFPQQVSQGSQMEDVLPFMSWPQESQSITSAVITRRLRFPGKEYRPPPLAGKSRCRNSMWDGRYCCSHFWKSPCSRRSKSLDE